ncbi:MAG TPA: sigma-54 dependent transcriptional regulator [Pyrinomonadaceae bacterium]|nr:sigma-54 dependent transcriptional regulator [Pyrinomonadaceae bacterium]
MSEAREKVLVVDDSAEFRDALGDALEDDFDIDLAASAEEAQRKLAGVGVVLLDVRLKEDGVNRDGLLLLEAIRQSQPELPVVMMTGYADIDMAVEALRLGATDFVQKSRVDVREFRKVIEKALERSKDKRRIASLEDDLRRLEPWEMVGDDPKIQEVRRLVEMVAQDGYTTVLVRGDTGTGKELVARAVHSRGWRREAPFVAVSPQALPRDLIESELFGHVKGAFTDAREPRVGYVEKAQGGVLFLDEVGELPPEMQVKLLRFLETRTFARLGSTVEVKVNVQIVAATNRNLEQAIRQGQFREDLYFRLKSMEIRIPPLRERPDDIPSLSDHFLFMFRQQGRTKLAGISPGALRLLSSYSFPGNIRELKNIIERSMQFAANQGHTLIEASDLPLDVQQVSKTTTSPIMLPLGEDGINLDAELARIELAYIQNALQQTEGKKTEAWRVLGLNDRFALRRRVKRIGEAYPHLISSFSLVQKLYYE